MCAQPLSAVLWCNTSKCPRSIALFELWSISAEGERIDMWMYSYQMDFLIFFFLSLWPCIPKELSWSKCSVSLQEDNILLDPFFSHDYDESLMPLLLAGVNGNVMTWFLHGGGSLLWSKMNEDGDKSSDSEQDSALETQYLKPRIWGSFTISSCTWGRHKASM